MEQLRNDVYKIPGDSNVYLIMAEEPFIIDTGNPEDRQHIKKELETIIPLKNIKHVLLTHLHYDHCGNVNLFPNATFYAHQQEIQDLKEQPQHFFFGTIPPELNNILRSKLTPYQEDSILGLDIIETPGHTKGSIALLDKKRNILFSGDTIFDNGIGRTDFANSQPETMHKSVTTLLNLIRNEGYELQAGHNY